MSTTPTQRPPMQEQIMQLLGEITHQAIEYAHAHAEEVVVNQHNASHPTNQLSGTTSRRNQDKALKAIRFLVGQLDTMTP